jgi:hypothetical protein
MSAILSAGYNVDYIDAEAINSVGLGTHQILVLPPTDRIPFDTVNKISLFAAEGGKVIVLGHAPSLTSDGKPYNPIVFRSFSTTVADESHLAEALHTAAAPDFKLADGQDSMKDQLGFIRRKLPSADIYFVANTSNQPVETTATFASTHKLGEQWDPDTGSPTPATADSQTLHLAPYESRIFVFNDPSASTSNPSSRPESSQSHREHEVERSASSPGLPTQLADLSTDWTVTFPSANATETQPTLTDWTASAETFHYSGEAVYARDFTLATPPQTSLYLEVEGGRPLPGAPNSPPEHPTLGSNGLPDPRVTRTGPGMRAWYDPPIHEAAIVFLNGQRAGSLWHPPYRLDVSKLLKPGENHIEIHVYNTALNAWSALPPHDYKPLIEKYGDRFQMQDLDKVQPIPSGLLGTIHLVTQDIK